MARSIGTFRFPSNFEVEIKGPLDARTHVTSFQDLLTLSGLDLVYNGFIATLFVSSGSTYNGIWQLINEAAPGATASWVKIQGGGSGEGPAGQTGMTGQTGRGVSGATVIGNVLFLNYDSGPSSNLGPISGGSTGQTGMTGMTGMTGQTGMTGMTGQTGRGITGATVIDGNLYLLYDFGPSSFIGPVTSGATGGTGPTGEAVLINAVTSNVQQTGAIDPGETLNTGTTFQQFVERLLTTVYPATPVAPFNTISLNQGNPFYEIGTTFNSPTNPLIITNTFNRGKINGKYDSGIWVSTLEQSPRAGTAIHYTFRGNPLVVVHPTNTTSINYTVGTGINSFTGTVYYGTGPTGFDSSGTATINPLIPGTVGPASASFTGVFPIYATTSSISSKTKQTLIATN